MYLLARTKFSTFWKLNVVASNVYAFPGVPSTADPFNYGQAPKLLGYWVLNLIKIEGINS